jgi:hypothetical protein
MGRCGEGAAMGIPRTSSKKAITAARRARSLTLPRLRGYALAVETVRSRTFWEWIGRVVLVLTGIVFLILDDTVAGIIAIVVGLTLSVIPLLGGGRSRV